MFDDRSTSRCPLTFAGSFFRLVIIARRKQCAAISFPLLFFSSRILLVFLMTQSVDCFAACFGVSREKGVGSVAESPGRNLFPFPRKVVAPWRGMRARNHHEWCWARTGASGAALASPRLGPKRNRHPRAPPYRVHHPYRPRGGNSGGDTTYITLH